MEILIRTDASQQIGSGHVMRCLTLANELRQKARMSFICRDLPGNMCDYIEQKGYLLHRLPLLGTDWQTDAQQTNAILAAENKLIDWLIVDHYFLNAQWEMTMRPYVNQIMVIDDMANRSHDCDLLLDQNLYTDMESRYKNLVPQHCKQLLGPEYALLRAEFLKARSTLRKRDGNIKRILIFMGGSDPTNETAKALEAIKLLNRSDITVDVVVGESNPYKEQVKQICAKLPNAAYYCQVSNMAELMVKADLAIGAGGSTNWERCCLGLPSLVMTIAENQEYLTQTLHEQGYLISLGAKQKVSAETISQNLYDILNEPERVLSFVDRGEQLVDGNGAKRVSSMIEETQNPEEYRLRKATHEDLLTYYHWANDETVRKNSFSPEPIDLETHKHWFQQKLNNPDTLLYILEKSGNPVGQIRFDMEEKIAHISYLIDSNYRGQGLGKLIVQVGIKQFFKDNSRKVDFQAAIKPENLVSHKIFQNIGFDKVIPKQTNKQSKNPTKIIYQLSFF
jgi:UDP-2,4-diacetamido-2,4,6-trideoxy-beta-L-altropyranose hydrolase